jgi:hypothetical protein
MRGDLPSVLTIAHLRRAGFFSEAPKSEVLNVGAFLLVTPEGGRRSCRSVDEHQQQPAKRYSTPR